jgi:hypothetical protein
VFALCQQKRNADARTAAEAFLSRHPEGPLAARVRGACTAR